MPPSRSVPAQHRPALPPAPTPCLWQGCPLLLWHLGGHASRTEPDPRCEPRIENRDDGRVLHWNVGDELGGLRRSARGQHAEVAPGARIRLFGAAEGHAYDCVFAIGDAVARSLRAPTLRGVITAIGATSIAIHDGSAVHRLSFYDFHRLNVADPVCLEDAGAAGDTIVQSGDRCRVSNP